MKTSNGTDETIEQLGAAHRRDADADPRWRALTMGTLSRDEAEVLRRASPELYALYRPFDAAEDERLVAGIQARLGGQSASSKVVPLSWWRERRTPLAGALALAAAFALVVASWPRSPLQFAWSEPRGGTAAAPHLSSVVGSPHERLAEMIVPVEPVRERVVVRGTLLVRPGATDPGRVRPWAPVLAPTADGTLLLSGTRLELFPGVPRGEWDMIVAVGRPGPALIEGDLLRLADHAFAGRDAGDSGPAGDCQVLKKRIVLEGPCVGTGDHPCLGTPGGEDGAP